MSDRSNIDSERDALLFSDGSMSVYPDGMPMSDIRREREDADRNVIDPAEMTKIVRVRCEVLDVIFDPAPKLVSEVEQLQAEVRRLSGCLLVIASATGAGNDTLRTSALHAATHHAEVITLQTALGVSMPMGGPAK